MQVCGGVSGWGGRGSTRPNLVSTKPHWGYLYTYICLNMIFNTFLGGGGGGGVGGD